MSTQQPPTIRAWQHKTDDSRVLLVWPDGSSMVVNRAGHIEDSPRLEPPDNWLPLGKHLTGTVRRSKETS